jgi:hypothetical protein
MSGSTQKITPEQAIAAIKKYGGARPAARALGCCHGWLIRLARRAAGPSMKPEAVNRAVAGKPKGVKSLTDFRQVYDKDTIVPAKIREALGKLGAGGWEYEVEFAKMAGVSLYDLGRVRDRFANNVVTIGRESKRAWAGSKALAQQMREML